jgi:hypothetical protein
MRGVVTFFAGILSVIAVGVLLIAYGLFNPRVATADGMRGPRAVYASDRAPLGAGDEIVYDGVRSPYASSGVRPVPAAAPAPVRRTVASRPIGYDDRPVSVERSSGRDWKKTALMIGGSTAAGAGLGGIFGGKKGALIGAALGGGASTLYEVTKR